MPYADRDKIQSRTNKYLTEESVDADMLAQAQAFADAEINSRLEHLRPFPSPTPDKISEISADLAAYFLIDNIVQDGTMDKPAAYALELYQRAQASLELIASGKAGLGSVEGEEEAEAPPPSVRFRPGRTRVLAHFDGVNPPPCYPYRGGRRLC